jgi:hypothetical protein
MSEPNLPSALTLRQPSRLRQAPSLLCRLALSFVVIWASGCTPAPQTTASGVQHPAPKVKADAPPASPDPSARPAPPDAPAQPAASNGARPAPLSGAPLPETPAGRQLSAWLEAFNSGDRQTLALYHERNFRYEVASRDVSTNEREHGLSQGTGGFDPRRFEISETHRLMVLLQERKGPGYARVVLEVAPEPPHAVTRFRIGPIPTPLEWLSSAEREARAVDAKKRRAVLQAIERELMAHYVSLETAQQVIGRLQKKVARGDYDSLSDAVAFADALSRDLSRLARDKHIGLHFGPMPPQPKMEGPEPPWLARVNYGFGAIERLRGNVAHVVIEGFPPLVDSQRRAIGERMTEIADADAVIIDLRQNGGGFPPTVNQIASYFFDEEPVHLNSIYRRDTNHTQELWSERTLPGRRFGSKKPVYVLSSRRTFSGGEDLAYTLQAQGRAVVVGEGTGGGAHPTQPYPIEGGFVLRVPWGRSINPVTATNWEGIGVVPDVPTPEDEALETAHRLALEKLAR